MVYVSVSACVSVWIKGNTATWHTCHTTYSTWGRDVCRWSHVREGSSMWHYLMFCSINDLAIQLGSVVGIAPLSPPPSPTYACLSTGALSSKVKCQMLSIPTRREGPGLCRGLGGPAFELVTEKHHYWARFALEHDCCHDCTMTTILTSVYLFYMWLRASYHPVLITEQDTSNTSSQRIIL